MVLNISLALAAFNIPFAPFIPCPSRCPLRPPTFSLQISCHISFFWTSTLTIPNLAHRIVGSGFFSFSSASYWARTPGHLCRAVDDLEHICELSAESHHHQANWFHHQICHWCDWLPSFLHAPSLLCFWMLDILPLFNDVNVVYHTI